MSTLAGVSVDAPVCRWGRLPIVRTRSLNALEEKTLRVFMRLLIVLPRSIDNDMQERAGLGLTKYLVLMTLSESPGRSLRMTDLAGRIAMSASRMTRVVAQLELDGLIDRSMNEHDKRSSVASLTDAGYERLENAWPAHLVAVRSLIFDHVDKADLPQLLRMLTTVLHAVEAPGQK